MLLALLHKAKHVVGELWPITKEQGNDSGGLSKSDSNNDNNENNQNPPPTGAPNAPRNDVVVVENVTGPFGACFYWLIGKSALKPPTSGLVSPITSNGRIPRTCDASLQEQLNNNNNNNNNNNDINNNDNNNVDQNKQETIAAEPVDISLVIGRQLMAKILHLDVRLEARRKKLYQEREAIG